VDSTFPSGIAQDKGAAGVTNLPPEHWALGRRCRLALAPLEPYPHSLRLTSDLGFSNRGKRKMRLAKLILGAIAAFGVARLLAPKETQDVVDNARRALQRGIGVAKEKTAEMSAMPERVYASAAARTKSAASNAVRKTKTSAPRSRKAATRPRAAKG
jgi:gas vesicle protein